MSKIFSTFAPNLAQKGKMNNEHPHSMSIAPNDIRNNEHREAGNNQQWHWQEPGKAWKGMGIYHVTLTVTSRQPLLGELVVPDDDPKQAWVKRTALGEAIVDCLWTVPKYHPDVRIICFDLMPNHLHTIWHVTRPMPTGIKSVVRGFWQAVKQIGREYSMSVTPNVIRDNERRPDPIFTEMPFIRTMSRKGQLDTMIQYTWLNPQRLATMRLMSGFFRVQDNIEIAGRVYKGVGNAELLQRAQYMPVHTRGTWIENAEKHGDDKELLDYMNRCILEARKGVVMVSPFISKYEQMVMAELLNEGLPFIYIADNGFRDYYKPQDSLFDAVGRKQVMILSPWEYDAGKKRVSRAVCVEMNKMAEEICLLSSITPNTIRQNNQE